MPQSFTPKFVDMVRVATTTQGTGPFVCGPASQGFSSFAEAVAVGDTFYYCAQGVDKPQEREVGRGTYLANGTIARVPLRGSLTSFTSGQKSLSLVAASEWFAQLQAVSTNADRHQVALTVAALAATPGVADVRRLLLEAGREGLFAWDGTVPVAVHQADVRQGLYIAPVANAVGAWVRSAAQPRDPRWFGAKGDGQTDDHSALQAWLDSGGALVLPQGCFFSSQKLIVRRQVKLAGIGYGFDNRLPNIAAMPGSRIRFPVGVGGLDIQNQGAPASVPAVLAAQAAGTWAVQEGANGSTFEDFALIGGGTVGGSGAGDGLVLRTLAMLRNVHVLSFKGKGFDLVGSADLDDGNPYGNLSTSSVVNCRAESNGSHGFHIRGRDANTIMLENPNAHLNGGWGIIDESLLGNSIHKPHLAGNALGSVKSCNPVAKTCIHDPYVEGDSGRVAEIGEKTIVYGGDISSDNNYVGLPPTVYSDRWAKVKFLEWHWGWDSPGTLTDRCVAFRSYTNGLALQGHGAIHDVALLNRSGNPALRIPTNSQNSETVGMHLAASFRLTSASGSYQRSDGNDLVRAVGNETLIYAVGSGSYRLLSGDNLFAVFEVDNVGNANARNSFRVNGQQVVGARGAAVPDATDPASTQAGLNALLARLRAHGLIAA